MEARNPKSLIKILAAKTALTLTLISGSLSSPALAGIPTFDATNVIQTTINAMESVSQTLQQIEQYQTQIQQYENQLQNTAGPDVYLWDQAQGTVADLLGATDALERYKQQLGSLDEFMSVYQDVDYYGNSPCFTAEGCSEQEQAMMERNRGLASQGQKQANDAMLKGLDQQQEALRNDARRLEKLQSSAQGGDGQMQALGFANQFASQQANQLLQIRGMLAAQQTAMVARMQAEADREAQETTARHHLYEGMTTPTDRSKSQEFKP